MVLKYISKTGSRIYGPPYTKAEEDEFYRRVGRGPITVAAQPVTVKSGTDHRRTGLSQEKLDLDCPERQLINRILTGLRYSYEDAGGIIEDLDFDWGATCRPLASSTPTEPRQVLPFRLTD